MCGMLNEFSPNTRISSVFVEVIYVFIFLKGNNTSDKGIFSEVKIDNLKIF